MLEPLFATAAADQAGELYCTLVPGLSTTPHNYPTTSALTASGSLLGLCKAAADPLSPPCEVRCSTGFLCGSHAVPQGAYDIFGLCFWNVRGTDTRDLNVGVSNPKITVAGTGCDAAAIKTRHVSFLACMDAVVVS